MNEAKRVKRTGQRRVEHWFYLFAHGTDRGGWRWRLHDLIACRNPWWDWGHRLMIVVGWNDCGSWSEVNPPTWFYRFGTPKRMWHTGYPLHPLSTIEVIKSYSEFRQRTVGMNEDQLYEWKAIGANQDGDLHLGHQFWGGSFYDLNRWEHALLRRYLRRLNLRQWFGARRWLYSLALHGAVNLRKPRACNITPPRGSGGYSHWHCHQKRSHHGPHRFGNYEWSGSDADRVQFLGNPPERSAS